ncbi:MAG TPA: twin-arginine translocase TatA/TatE family subunit [bacterium]
MNLGWGELLLIFGIVVLLFGARRVPDIARSVGQAIREFQRSLRGNGDDRGNGKGAGQA